MPDGQTIAQHAPVRFARSSLVAFLVYGIGSGLTYLSQLAIARIVGAESYGIYAFVVAWMTVLAYLAALGFDVSLLRLLPSYRTRAAWGLLKGVTRYAERRVLATGLGIVLCGACITLLWAKPAPELLDTTLIGLFLVPVWSLLWVRAARVRAFGGVLAALAPDRLVREGLLLGVMCLASLQWKAGVDASWAMLATLASSATGLLLVSIAAGSRWPRSLDAVQPEYAARTWRRAALPLVLIAVAEAGMNRTGVVLFGWLGFTKEAGIYALVFNIASLALLPRMAVNALFAPMVAELFVRNDRAALQALMNKGTLWTLLGAMAISVPLLLLAEQMLGWFGGAFLPGAPALRILLVGQVMVAASGSQLCLMTMTRHEQATAAILILCAIGNGIVTACLIGPFGLAGAALASTAMLIVCNGAMLVFTWQRLELTPSIFTVLKRASSIRMHRV